MSAPTELGQPTKTYRTDTYAAISPARPELSTKGKSAVVSGGGSGIGGAIALSLAKSGISHLAILGRTEKSLQQKKAEIDALGQDTKVQYFVVDLTTDVDAVRKALESFSDSIGKPIDILIANAGYFADLRPVAEAELSDWWKGFELNIKGNFILLQAFLAKSAKNAAIVHVSTAAIHIPLLPGYSSYRPSKLAATKLFDCVAFENPDKFVLQYHPGVIAGTEMVKKFGPDAKNWPYDKSTFVLRRLHRCMLVLYDWLLTSFATVELAADFAVWAVSPEASFLHGRFVWANWDVEELKAQKDEIQANPAKFTLGLLV